MIWYYDNLYELWDCWYYGYCDEVDWDSEPNWSNNSYWYVYGTDELLNSKDVCFSNPNTTCHRENDYNSLFQDWRVTASITCRSGYTEERCYYWYEPEECPIFYIYPPSPNGTVCPCCTEVCVGAENETGTNMNISIYMNNTYNPTYQLVQHFENVPNGTYCFCLQDGIFNSTYQWYVNLTEYNNSLYYLISPIFQFRTLEPEQCPCSPYELKEVIEKYDRIQDDTWIVGISLLLFGTLYLMRRK
jgi:hypothetical protein